MPPGRNREKFQQLTGFEWGMIIGLREGGFSYRAIGARVQRNSYASLEAVNRRAPNNSKNWQWTTEGDVRARRSTPTPHGGE
ncbi:hypothetical protein TNCV_3100621 [Trichonephila clavipes]|nr:hypothetical protein TNCV_3100621 [Trichonephila clavipes]